MPRKTKEAIAKELATFVRQYGKRAQKGKEPNDRSYDPTIERYIKRLKPEDLDVLLNGDEDERLHTRISK